MLASTSDSPLIPDGPRDSAPSVKTDQSPATLGTAPIGRLLLKYSVPAIIASVAVSFYNIIDSIFIGRGVGAMALRG